VNKRNFILFNPLEYYSPTLAAG